MTKLEPEEIKAVLAEYKMNNCDVSFRCDATLDELIDAIEGNRIYMPCICECALEQAYPGPYVRCMHVLTVLVDVLNKIDAISIEELGERLASNFGFG